MNVPVHIVGPIDQNKSEVRSPLAEIWDTACQVLVIVGIGCPISEALIMSNLNSFHATEQETDVGTVTHHEISPTSGQLNQWTNSFLSNREETDRKE
jgi:hypothetical protein